MLQHEFFGGSLIAALAGDFTIVTISGSCHLVGVVMRAENITDELIYVCIWFIPGYPKF